MKPGYTIGEATQFVENAAKQILPPDVQGGLQGEALTFRDTVSSLTILMVLAVFVMYVILAILYESYLHPITVLSSLPVALVGGLLTLQIFGAEASLYAFIGMFMLMGIVKKNGIMIVDFAQQRVEQGLRDDDAIHEASMERFRPIMMTTMAALMGALPIALGFGADGASRRPLGLVVVGGLIVSQFITLYVTPAIYLYLEDFQERVLDRTSFFRSHPVHAEQPGDCWRCMLLALATIETSPELQNRQSRHHKWIANIDHDCADEQAEPHDQARGKILRTRRPDGRARCRARPLWMQCRPKVSTTHRASANGVQGAHGANHL